MGFAKLYSVYLLCRLFEYVLWIRKVLTNAVRFIYFAVDPHGVRDFMGVGAAVVFDISLILWCIGTFMLYLYW